MVVNFCKTSCSITVTTIVVKIYNLKNVLPPVTKSAVWYCEQRMKTCVTPIEKCRQGNMDCNLPWAKANHRQCWQQCMLVGIDHKAEWGICDKYFVMKMATTVLSIA
jgi:hypothetical protein